MSYRSILVHLDRNPTCTQRVQVAIDVARHHNAQLIGVAPTGLPYMPYAAGMEGVGLYYAETAKALRDLAQESVRAFDQQTAATGLTAVVSMQLNQEAGAAIATHGRCTDLVVLSQIDPRADDAAVGRDFVEYVLLNVARPVLIVPYAGTFSGMSQAAVVAWDGSRESARAVADALPMLKAAQKVTVMVFNQASATGDASSTVSATDIAPYLARHGVNVELSNEQTGIDIGNAILSRLADYGADLLVMGGYSHSRFREAILGGVTKTILSHMTVPVLMSH
jgi:nucleotide-binding universal stress UspA family protein